MGGQMMRSLWCTLVMRLVPRLPQSWAPWVMGLALLRWPRRVNP